MRETDTSPWTAARFPHGVAPALPAGAAFLLVCLLPLGATAGVFAATADTDWSSLALFVAIFANLILAPLLSTMVAVNLEPTVKPRLIGCFVVATLLGIGLGGNAAIHANQAYLHWYGMPKQARISLVEVDDAKRVVRCTYILGGVFADQWMDEFPVETQPDRAACEAKVGTVIEVMVDPRRRVQPRTSADLEGIGTALWIEGGLLLMAGLGAVTTAGISVRPHRGPTEAGRVVIDRPAPRRRPRPRRQR
ncbi:hypothetical protein [Nonomuraea sp. KM88]|uniref:hypothetical protein n=1 Tax=Nonomuraea sp. KM88 TaxID=3457427 RepID=UPI003FCC2BA4